VIVDFIREHADHRVDGGLRWRVEPICRVLTEHGLQVAPSTYYTDVGKAPTARKQRDEYLLGQIRRVHAANYSVRGTHGVAPAQPRGHRGGPPHGGAAEGLLMI
jgi:putative transposase